MLHPPEGHPCPLLSPASSPYRQEKQSSEPVLTGSRSHSWFAAELEQELRAPDAQPPTASNHTRDRFLVCSSHRHCLSSQLTHVCYSPPATQTYALVTRTPSAITREKEGGWVSGQPDDRPASVSGLALAATPHPTLPGQTASRLVVRLRQTHLLTVHMPTIHTDSSAEGALETRHTLSAVAASQGPSLDDMVVNIQS